jgi:amino acid adenylation domain-containing protein
MEKFLQGQTEHLPEKQFESKLAYWKRLLRDDFPVLELPTDRRRTPTQTFQGAIHALKIPQSLTDSLNYLSERQGATLFMTLLAAFKSLLFRYTGQGDIIVWVPSAGGDRPKREGLIGSFINPLFLRTSLEGNLSFRELLGRVRQVILEAQVSQDIPWPKLAEEFPSERDLLRSSIFQVLFQLNNVPSENLEVKGLKFEDLTLESGIDSFDLKLDIWETPVDLSCVFQYNADLFEAATIERMAGHFQNLLEGIIINPEQRISDLPLLTEAERHRILVEWNDTKSDYPKDKCIHQLFEEQVERTPDAIAVVFENQKLTYRELNHRANQLAHYLRTLGVVSDVLVGICIEPSLKMVIGLLGILKAGGAYVPLDPTYPLERLAGMLSDSQCSLLLTQQKWLSALPESQASVICWETNLEKIDRESTSNLPSFGSGSSLAYVMYTSGSTGKPKGVAIPHRGILRLVLNTDYIQFGPDDRVAQASNTSFDAATFEIWGSLIHGARLVGIPRNILLSPQEFATQLRENEISILFLTTAVFNQIVSLVPKAFNSVKHLLFGGEAVDPRLINEVLKQGTPQRLLHVYGPTESTTFSSWYLVEEVPEEATTIPIGRPIANTQFYVLDKYLNPVPIGIPGELYIGGDGLAKEYYHRPDLTDEKFIRNPFSQEEEKLDRLYKTGDLVRFRSDGNLEFVGRLDNQVKIRGFRIELGEIEIVLNQHPAIKDVVVQVREDEPGNKQLVTYLVPNPGEILVVNELRNYLQDKIASYMIPSIFYSIESFSLTPNGKVDRRSLSASNAQQLLPTETYVAPQTNLESLLSGIWKKLLKLERVGIHDNFFDLGGNSLLSMQVVAQLQEELKLVLPIVKLFQYPTISDLANYLNQERHQESMPEYIEEKHSERQLSTDAIAIIGMVGRFPGAANVEELWHNLCEGVASTTFLSDGELDPSIDPELRNNPNYVKAKGLLEGADYFDAAFFGISPREAEIMDPQQRIFLEVAYEALENAGYNPERFDGSIGLYAGSGNNTYFAANLCGQREVIERVGEFQTMLANEKDFLTTRVSYKLNLQGPSVSVNTACSTSLVAVIHAFNSLRNHECDLALAGGISITTPLKSGYLYQEGAMLSPDGYCRPFDANAQGTMFNNGVGIVVLKRLEDALRDGDRIEAVIRGVGINNDGANKVSFTAPSVEGQAKAIQMAHACANVNPETISYVETHGTATPLGDPIEIAALTQAFRTQTQRNATGFCAIGSIKSNVGHLVCAAGVAGLIKTALALKHQKIPPTLHFQTPNPNIDFANSPFYVNAQLIPWQTEHLPRRAGVSSFGVGGTNAHVVVEEAPDIPASSSSRPRHLLLLSAKTPSALEAATTRLGEHLKVHPEHSLADVAYTLQVGRPALPYRRFVVCKDPENAIQALETLPPQRTATGQMKDKSPEVVFMFPGQGTQYVGMGLNLYQNEPIFRETVDRCAEILQPYLGEDLRKSLYPQAEDLETAAAALQETRITQPAIFTLEYALAKLWNYWGIYPQAFIGHSIGEFVAACLAEVFSLEDALRLVAMRGRLMQDLPKGSMLSVRLSATDVERRLSPELSIAAINGPSLCVVSGTRLAVQQLQQELEREDVVCKYLHTSHAFHSPMMEPILEPFTQCCRTVSLSEPKIPIVSSVTSQWLSPEQATDHLYWARHLRLTVRFAEGVKTLWQQPDRLLLEVGPRTTAATLARQQAKNLKRQIAISSLGSTAEDNGEWTALLQAIGQLWLAGVSVDWQRFYTQETRHRLPLPTYPFERQRFWVDPKPAVRPSPPEAASSVELRSPPEFSDSARPFLPENSMPEPRKQRLIPVLREVLETTSGLDIASADTATTFLDMGLDSLSLTQVALALTKKFNLKITFRHLLENCPNLETLADFVDRELPPAAFPAPPPPASPASIQPAVSTPTPLPMTTASLPISSEKSSAIEALCAQQLQIMARQLELLSQGGVHLPAAPAPDANLALLESPSLPTQSPKIPKSSGPGVKIDKSVNHALTSDQQSYLDRIIARYIARTQESKRQTQEHRKYLADPRTVSGFAPLLKEMVYPIVTDRASGSKLWDVDGNEYVDLTNGFGLNFFGWSPDFVTEAVKAQLDRGIEIGPQTPLAGKVAKLVAEFTGMERVAFCNTGSEAVMTTLRLARTVTGRELVATFAGDYHGTFDEVLYRQGAKLKTFPAAPGILPSMFENLLVLDYDTPESFEILRNRADDLAAILVEPVRSRDPGLQPQKFLQDLRSLTVQSGTAYIFDEVVTGFRVHPGGAQAYFDIQADMATYGKVVGGGLPIGIVAGKAEYMDALDGGFWQYGDSSIPEVGVTFFAGTFVRHPMALAAAEAVLNRLKEGGPELQRSLAERVNGFATHLNQYFRQIDAPIEIAYFSSFFYINYPRELPYAGLLFYLLREKGIHVWDHRPCFFTLSHTDADIEFVISAFKDSVAELQVMGFLPQPASSTNGKATGRFDRNHPPQPGARLGRDPEGNPAWYVPDLDRPGKFLQVGNISQCQA